MTATAAPIRPVELSAELLDDCSRIVAAHEYFGAGESWRAHDAEIIFIPYLQLRGHGLKDFVDRYILPVPEGCESVEDVVERLSRRLKR